MSKQEEEKLDIQNKDNYEISVLCVENIEYLIFHRKGTPSDIALSPKIDAKTKDFVNCDGKDEFNANTVWSTRE